MFSVLLASQCGSTFLTAYFLGRMSAVKNYQLQFVYVQIIAGRRYVQFVCIVDAAVRNKAMVDHTLRRLNNGPVALAVIWDMMQPISPSRGARQCATLQHGCCDSVTQPQRPL